MGYVSNNQLDRLETKISQLIRVGTVTAKDPTLHKVQAQIKDTCGSPLTTAFLPVLVPRACEDMEYDLPDIGSAVLIVFLSNGLEDGFVIGSYYHTNTPPPVTSDDIWHHKFKDGTYIEYNRSSHKLTADVKGDVDIHSTGNMTCRCDGDFSVQANGKVNITSGGNMTLGSDSGITFSGPSVGLN